MRENNQINSVATKPIPPEVLLKFRAHVEQCVHGGDLVTIRPLDEMVAEFGELADGSPRTFVSFVTDMFRYCRKTFEVRKEDEHYDDTLCYPDTHKPVPWYFSIDTTNVWVEEKAKYFANPEGYFRNTPAPATQYETNAELAKIKLSDAGYSIVKKMAAKNLKVGGKVKIRPWDEMLTEFGYYKETQSLNPFPYFIEKMKPFCGDILTVDSIDGEYFQPTETKYSFTVAFTELWNDAKREYLLEPIKCVAQFESSEQKSPKKVTEKAQPPKIYAKPAPESKDYRRRYKPSRSGFMHILPLAREFYVMESALALCSIPKQENSEYGFEPFRHSHEKWREDFDAYRSKFTAAFARAIYDYTAIVVAGELRHCNSHAGYRLRNYIASYGSSREQTYAKAKDKYSARSLLEAGSYMFNPEHVKWSSSYGGKKWQLIAEAGLMYGKVNDTVFIDHCVDLSHNNSVYFDKGAGIFAMSEGSSKYKDFLDMKRDESPEEIMQETIGTELYNLMLRADALKIFKYTRRFLRSFSSLDYSATRESERVKKADSSVKFLLNRRPFKWSRNDLELSVESSCNVYSDDYCERRDEDER